MLVASKCKVEITQLKELHKSEFYMKEMGSAEKILGMEIRKDRSAGIVFVAQCGYIERMLRKYNMHLSKLVVTTFKSTI